MEVTRGGSPLYLFTPCSPSLPRGGQSMKGSNALGESSMGEHISIDVSLPHSPSKYTSPRPILTCRLMWWQRMMGNRQSYAPPPQHDYNGPLFGGHYAGDFSIRVSRHLSLCPASRSSPLLLDVSLIRQKGRANLNKALPPPPPTKSVRFGAAPP